MKLLAKLNFIYRFAFKVIANRIVHGDRLVPSHLASLGFVKSGDYWIEHVKDRDKVWIQFEGSYYRVFHGENRTYIATESSLAWFENYYTFIHPDNGRYSLAKI